MSNNDAEKSTKDEELKSVPTVMATQEQSAATSTGPVNAEWQTFQAFSPMPAHNYLASSPQTHPYMWGMQHIVPAYGAPPPYVAMYPHHGGMYAHPSMPLGSYPFSPFSTPPPNGVAEPSGNTLGVVEADVKSSDKKEKLPIKRSKGSLGSLNMIMGKNNDATTGSNSKSGESGSEGSSDGSDDNSQNDSQPKSADRQDLHEAETSLNRSSMHGSQYGGSNAAIPSMTKTMSIVLAEPGGIQSLATNSNTGMEYLSGPNTSVPVLHGNAASAAIVRASVPGTRDVRPQPWRQDDRELKRQRRKQSNRESARRSRLRKQSECDELAQKVEALNDENMSLRAEISRAMSEFENLASENASLKAQLGESLPGTEERRSVRDEQNVDKDFQ